MVGTRGRKDMHVWSFSDVHNTNTKVVMCERQLPAKIMVLSKTLSKIFVYLGSYESMEVLANHVVITRT